MWETSNTNIEHERVQKFEIKHEGSILTFAEVIDLWQSSHAFRSYFTSLLSKSSFKGFRWETPCITDSTLTKPFEFVLLQANQLHRPVDRKAFSQHFDSEKKIVIFPNLGRNATLVVPCPVTNENAYGHLASFLRTAPEDQIHELWISVAAAMNDRVSHKPVWLSTAGMGVSWLHVRLDDRPKYYGHRPYRETC